MDLWVSVWQPALLKDGTRRVILLRLISPLGILSNISAVKDACSETFPMVFVMSP